MYQAIDDPYCYPGTTVLINKLGIRDANQLEAFEEEVTRERAAQPLPDGRLSVTHFRAIHRHLFQDVFGWAGRLRTVRMTRGTSTFAYPEHIEASLADLFTRLKRDAYLRGRSPEAFAAGAASFLADLNAIHAFRDGNGRTQLTFMSLLAVRAGHPLDLERIDPPRFLDAMIASFYGREALLVERLQQLIA